jgi:hypothetical protein
MDDEKVRKEDAAIAKSHEHTLSFESPMSIWQKMQTAGLDHTKEAARHLTDAAHDLKDAAKRLGGKGKVGVATMSGTH